MKRFIATILTLALMCSFVPAAFAATDEATQAAQTLYDLGLFQGIGNNADGTPNFDLDRTPTRHEAVTMLVRLLGKDGEAKAGTWETPFTDVDDWAKPYVGYAYANRLTTGTSETTFGGAETINASQYLTFVLRALGYSSETDFQWDKPWELSDKIGLTSGNYDAGTTDFTRGDVAVISAHALDMQYKEGEAILRDTLFSTSVVRNIAPTEVKGSIMADAAAGFRAEENAFTNLATAARHLSVGETSDGLALFQNSLSDFQVAQGYFNEAIALCGDYDDTQAAKVELMVLSDNLSPVCAYYNITKTNAWDYANAALSVGESSKGPGERLTAEFAVWTNDTQ